jgi:1-acyl-sn-glycerol-3-phosphate acyltransferase
MKQSLQAIEDGKSLVIYPEGGISAPRPPEMSRFKDGAFRAAIEKQIPLVPVTIPHNWIILPDPENVLRWGTIKVIFHKPIETKGLTLADVDNLKEEVYNIIDKELKKQNEIIDSSAS